MKRLFLAIILIISAFLLLSSTSDYEKRILSDTQWIEDIDFLDSKLREQHSDLFKFISEDEWEKSIQKLKAEVPQLSDNSIKFRISQIVTSIGDAHTSMMPSELLSPVPSPILKGENPAEIEDIIVFPIKCDYFDDGIRVIGCDSKYKDILGYKLISINDININSIINDIGTLMSYDYGNEQKSSDYAIKNLNIYDFLKFFNIVDSYKAEYVFENDKNEKIQITLNAVENNDIDYMSLSKKDMKTSIMPEGESKFYWYKHFEEDNILFLKFNSFTSNTGVEKYLNFYSFQDVLLKEINKNNYDKLVIDLRNNRGGKIVIKDAMIEMFKYNVNLHGENIYVLTSKETNSAAVLLAWNLQNKIGATIVGEGTGGNINIFITHYGQFELPNSKLKLSYSYKFNNNKDGYNGGVKPDIEIIQSYEEYINGVDSCYEYIRNISK